MKLYHSTTSPFVRKVTALLHKTGRAGDVEIVSVSTTPVATDAAVAATNPLGKIPCLVRDDGPALYDSRVVSRYLDARFGAGLYPSGDAIWATLTLEALADGLLEAAILCVYEARLRRDGERSEDWLEGQRAKVRRALDALESRWLAHLSGPADMGAVGACCALEYLDFRRELGGWGEWREGRPGIEKWAAAFSAQPWMRATAPA